MEITQEAWNSLVALGADVCSRYNFSLKWEDSWSQNGEWNNHKDNSLTVHKMFSSTDCPGQYIMDHLTQLANEVNSKIGAPTNGTSGSSSSTTTSNSGDALSKIPAGVINLEFSYGYNDGQMSEVHRGVMTEYGISFDPTGATLTIEGVSLEFVSFNDPNSVTYKGMTIEEIIRSIAEEEGWIIDDDSIEPIADVKESITYSLTTASAGGLTNVYNDNSSSEDSGTVNDGTLTDIQNKVVEISKTSPSPGKSLCERWVEKVLEDAGVPRVNQTCAAEACRNFCHSTNRSELKVGMIVATEKSGGTGSGYGHVGIYIGNNKVRHNVGTIKEDSLDDWINTYGPNGPCQGGEVRWGWYNNQDLSK